MPFQNESSLVVNSTFPDGFNLLGVKVGILCDERKDESQLSEMDFHETFPFECMNERLR